MLFGALADDLAIRCTSFTVNFGSSVRHREKSAILRVAPEVGEPYYVNAEVDVQRAHCDTDLDDSGKVLQKFPRNLR